MWLGGSGGAASRPRISSHAEPQRRSAWLVWLVFLVVWQADICIFCPRCGRRLGTISRRGIRRGWLSSRAGSSSTPAPRSHPLLRVPRPCIRQACVARNGRRNKGLRPAGVAERQSGPQSEARFRPLRARIAHHRRERSEQRARLRFSATTPFANLSTCHRAKPLVWLASATTCLLSIICYLRPRQRRIFCYLLSVICYLLSVICYLRCASSASSVLCYLRGRPASASAPLPARLCPRA